MCVTLQQNLSKYYKFEKVEKLCEYFNKFMNTLKREREQATPTDKYPWLDLEDERRQMTDREILEKYVDLNNSCLNKCYLWFPNGNIASIYIWKLTAGGLEWSLYPQQ